MDKIIISSQNVTIEEVVDVARNRYSVELSRDIEENINRARRLVEQYVDEGRIEYGITTGFGKFSDIVISREETVKLQRNLIVSHACGVGEEFPEEVVRGLMFLRAVALSKGYSGVRVAVIQLLIEMLNKGVHPVVYQKGSLGASGDLVPLAHMTLVMMGEGEAFFNGERMSGKKAMEEAGIKPIQLVEKEGLALINGTQVMTAIGAIAIYDAVNLMKSCDIISAMSFEALRGIEDALDPSINRVRPHKGQMDCADNLRSLMAGSGLVTKKQELRVQDAYTLRCIPQIHGASRDAVDYVKRVIEIEMNSVTDNPLVFADEEKVISAGNFHSQPVAFAMDFLGIALSELANVSERRIERLVNFQLNDLPPFLTLNGGLNSGFMIAQYSAASLVSENKVLSHPASVDSIPSSANQEDHVSMGTIAARKARSILSNTLKVLAIEYLAASQALEFRKNALFGAGTSLAYGLIRKSIRPLTEDRIMYADINCSEELIVSGKLVAAVEAELGNLL